MADTSTVDAAVAGIVAAHGRLDVVVNNAGVTRGSVPPSELVDMSDAEWDEVHEINLKGTFRVTRAALPHLQRGGGVVVCVSSIIGSQQGWATRVPYAASKAGVEGFVKALAVEVARDGIRVVGVAPGLTLPSAQGDAHRRSALDALALWKH